jgi:chemotaxis protein MotA
MIDWADISRFIDPVSMLIVGGGAMLVAATRSSGDDALRAFTSLRPLFIANPEADAHAAIVAVGKIEKIAEARGVACADRVETAERFLRRAGRRLSSAPSADAFARWADLDLESRAQRHEGAIAFWRTAAETAPGMGMIGTIIGLIEMFAAMADVSRIGPAMALAMLTTLYGIILSAVVAAPIAARLERLSEAERLWQRRALDRMIEIARAELAPAIPVRSKPTLRTVT